MYNSIIVNFDDHRAVTVRVHMRTPFIGERPTEVRVNGFPEFVAATFQVVHDDHNNRYSHMDEVTVYGSHKQMRELRDKLTIALNTTPHNT